MIPPCRNWDSDPIKFPNLEMFPVINDHESKFVVVTYWWGRGNLNKNIQRPCPDEIKMGQLLTKQPETYDKMIDDWIKNNNKMKLNYLCVEYPMFAVKGGYQNAINFKPYFIECALRACYPRSVLYIDGDMQVLEYPHIFDQPGIDFAGRSWSIDGGIDFRERYARSKPCYDPYVFETSGGTLFFGQTEDGYFLLDEWQNAMKTNVGKAEDRVLSYIINKQKLLARLHFIQLSNNYLWLTDKYNLDPILVKERTHKIIEHPACLTSEEIAFELSDENLQKMKNRIPFRYVRYVENMHSCNTFIDNIYEYLFFRNKKVAKQQEDYIESLKKYTKLKIIPFDEKYGKYNNVVEENKQIMREFKKQINSIGTVILTTDVNYNSKTYPLYFVSTKNLMAAVVSCLKKGLDVIYVPEGSKKIEKFMSHKDDLIAINDNKDKSRYSKDYYLSIPPNSPIFFSHRNPLLQDLVLMSKTLKQFVEIFNGSSGFLNRLKCVWV